MNRQSTRGSILERAAELFDLEAEFVRGVRPGVPAPAVHEASPPVADAPWPTPEIVAERQPARPKRQATAPNVGVRSIDRGLLRAHGFIEPDGSISVLAEEFRIVKRRLLSGFDAKKGGNAVKRQTILVCSAQPDEGKTFCAVNLALSMAGEKDLEVLLIDGDFAKPEIPALLGMPAAAGFSDALVDPNLDINTLVIQTDIKGFSLLPAGRQANDITELLASARTSEVLQALIEGHPNRVIVFDSPPALAASPASVLASHAGQVMLVVRADQTTEGDLREALSLLSACDSISLMLNRVSLALSGRRFGSYYEQGESP